MKNIGWILIILGVVVLLGSIGTGLPGAGFVFMLIFAGIGGFLVYAAGARRPINEQEVIKTLTEQLEKKDEQGNIVYKIPPTEWKRQN